MILSPLFLCLSEKCMKRSCRAGPLFSGIQASLSIIFKHRMSVFYLLCSLFKSRWGTPSEQQQQSAECSFKSFSPTRWFVVPAVRGTTFFNEAVFSWKKTVNNWILVAPPLRPVPPLSSRCILGIETTFKTLSWNQFLFDRRQEDAGGRRWRGEKERNEASLSISTPFSLSLRKQRQVFVDFILIIIKKRMPVVPVHQTWCGYTVLFS